MIEKVDDRVLSDLKAAYYRALNDLQVTINFCEYAKRVNPALLGTLEEMKNTAGEAYNTASMALEDYQRSKP